MTCDQFTLATHEAGITPPRGCGMRAAELAHLLRATPLPVQWRKGEHHALACKALGPLIRGGAAALNQVARVYQLTPLGEQWLAALEAAELLTEAITTAAPGARSGVRSIVTAEFIAHLKALAATHATTRDAVRALVAAWRAGEVVPGLGTWREYFKPAPATCPDELPQGWSERNLYSLINQ